MADLAKRLGVNGFSADSEEVFDELTRASAGGKADYRGISYQRITAENGVFWPCPSALYSDTPRLFVEDFPTPDRRAHFRAVEQPNPAEPPDDEFPYYLTTGRIVRQNQSGTQTRSAATPPHSYELKPCDCVGCPSPSTPEVPARNHIGIPAYLVATGETHYPIRAHVANR
jgi:predicted molibdopterin-dependent oxidoreductase YjgC